MLEIPTGADIKEARKMKGITQGELADMCDMSQAMISRMERDDVNPRVKTLRKVCTAIRHA